MRDSIRISRMKMPRSRTFKFLPALVLPVISVVGVVWLMAGTVFAQSGDPTGQIPKQTSPQTDVQILEGRWIRSDGGYVLELGEIKKDGSLKASYFNPRPIKVFSAKWSRRDKKINLFVELRDINYPGSKYNLQYDPKSDRLKGTYFQAVEKQTFDIEFVRATK